jgi:murein DD-endopeptidase MepM/ murein hydrolase activator NlpD
VVPEPIPANVVLTRSVKGFLKPVGGQIISGYGGKADGLHNDGVNIKATRGDAVRAAEQGVVVYNGNQIEGYGNMVLIRHADGFMTAYAHMDKMLVKKGERVSRGQTIGTVGSTGHVSTPQLHFEIRKGKDAVNPAQYIGV